MVTMFYKGGVLDCGRILQCLVNGFCRVEGEVIAALRAEARNLGQVTLGQWSQEVFADLLVDRVEDGLD